MIFGPIFLSLVVQFTFICCKPSDISDFDADFIINGIQPGERDFIELKKNGEKEDFYFEKEVQPYDDVSIGVQSLFVVFTQSMKKLQNQISRVETKMEAVLDRLNHVDCYDLKMQDPLRTSGAYTIYLDHLGKRPVRVNCDMVTAGGGWTVLQQRLGRKDNTSMSKVHFDRSYHDYKVGFGVDPDDDYWIGLENIYMWTNSRPYELRIELEDFRDNKGHAIYKSFSVDSERYGYRLNIGQYSGDIGDSMSNSMSQDNFTANGMMFSAKDKDQDTSFEINCATYWDIGGWWFNRCSWANLNGPYRFPGEKDGIGINWHKWRNKEYIKATTMMIRPITRN